MKRFFMKRFYNRFRKLRQNKKAISDALGRILRPDFRRWTQNFLLYHLVNFGTGGCLAWLPKHPKPILPDGCQQPKV